MKMLSKIQKAGTKNLKCLLTFKNTGTNKKVNRKILRENSKQLREFLCNTVVIKKCGNWQTTSSLLYSSKYKKVVKLPKSLKF